MSSDPAEVHGSLMTGMKMPPLDQEGRGTGWSEKGQGKRTGVCLCMKASSVLWGGGGSALIQLIAHQLDDEHKHSIFEPKGKMQGGTRWCVCGGVGGQYVRKCGKRHLAPCGQRRWAASNSRLVINSKLPARGLQPSCLNVALRTFPTIYLLWQSMKAGQVPPSPRTAQACTLTRACSCSVPTHMGARCTI